MTVPISIAMSYYERSAVSGQRSAVSGAVERRPPLGRDATVLEAIARLDADGGGELRRSDLLPVLRLHALRQQRPAVQRDDDPVVAAAVHGPRICANNGFRRKPRVEDANLPAAEHGARAGLWV